MNRLIMNNYEKPPEQELIVQRRCQVLFAGHNNVRRAIGCHPSPTDHVESPYYPANPQPTMAPDVAPNSYARPDPSVAIEQLNTARQQIEAAFVDSPSYTEPTKTQLPNAINSLPINEIYNQAGQGL
jgi:hypothetical protein